MARSKGRVKVRGTCRDGHTTEAVSDPGRVTWEGPCAHQGCELKVKGRRVPGSVETEPGDAPETHTATSQDDPHEVIEVRYAQEPAAPGPNPVRRASDPEPTGGDPDDAGTGTPPADPPAPDEPARVPEEPGAGADREDRGPQPRAGRGRFRSRLVGSAARRRAARGGPSEAQDWRIPGILPR